jgi:O-antigen ligase
VSARLLREDDQPVLLRSRQPPVPILVHFLLRSPERYGLTRLRPDVFLLLLTAFLALQFLIPARLVIGGLGAAGRPSVVIALGLSLIWLASWFRTNGVPRGAQPVRWIIAAYLTTAIFSYAVGYARGLPEDEASSATRSLLLVIAMCGLAVSLADGVPDRQTLDSILRRLTHFSGFMAAVGTVQSLFRFNPVNYIRIPGLQVNASLIEIGDRGSANVARVAGTANHYIEFGVVLALVTPIAVHYAMQASGHAQQIRRWALTLLIASGAPISISRSAIVALAVCMVILALSWTLRTRILALVCGIVAAGVFYALRPKIISTLRSLFRNAETDPSVQSRLRDYPIIEGYFADRPWLGRGLGTFLPKKYIQLDNQLLATLVTSGLVGLAVLLVLFGGGYFVARSIRHHATDESARHLGHVLAASLIAALVASGTFDSMAFPTFAGVVFLLIGAVGALFRLRRAPASSPGYGDLRVRSGGFMPPVLAPALAVRWQRLLETWTPQANDGPLTGRNQHGE